MHEVVLCKIYLAHKIKPVQYVKVVAVIFYTGPVTSMSEVLRSVPPI